MQRPRQQQRGQAWGCCCLVHSGLYDKYTTACSSYTTSHTPHTTHVRLLPRLLLLELQPCLLLLLLQPHTVIGRECTVCECVCVCVHTCVYTRGRSRAHMRGPHQRGIRYDGHVTIGLVSLGRLCLDWSPRHQRGLQCDGHLGLMSLSELTRVKNSDQTCTDSTCSD